MARTSAELTPEEILIIGDLVPVWSPWQVPVVNTGWTGLEYKTFSWGWDMLASTYDPAGWARQVSFACTTQTAITDYTFTGSEARDSGYLVTTASNRTVNINADLFTTGYEVSICKGTNNTNTVTIDAQTGNNINWSQTFVLTQYNEVVTLLKDGADTWKIKSHYYPISWTNTGDQTSTAWLSNTTNKNLVTDAQLTVIGNTSGTNTGDNAPNTNSWLVHTTWVETIWGNKTFSNDVSIGWSFTVGSQIWSSWWTSFTATPTWSGGTTDPTMLDIQSAYKLMWKTLHIKIWLFYSGWDRTGATISLPTSVASSWRTIFASWSTKDWKPFFPYAFNSQNYINCSGFTQSWVAELYISGTCETA